jgi:protein O-GlcNAc transferase
MAISSDILNKAREHLHAGRLDQAEAALRRLLQKPQASADPSGLYALVLLGLNRLEQADHFARSAVRLAPTVAAYHNALGLILGRRRQHAAAVDELREAVQLEPASIGFLHNLGDALINAFRYAQAADVYESILRLEPLQPHATMELAVLLMEGGRAERGLELVEASLHAHPDDPDLGAVLCFQMNYLGEPDPPRALAAHRQYGKRISRLAAKTPPAAHTNTRDPDRRLRIAYLSADFRDHSVAFFLEPILAHHDRTCFEVCCYACSDVRDAVTARLKSHAALWRDAAALDDEALAALIRSDRIDILVDLAGHTTASRLPMLARRPAPVQATYLGYPSTTGLAEVDYRIVDAITDPPGDADRWATEKLVRLDGCFVCYSGLSADGSIRSSSPHQASLALPPIPPLPAPASRLSPSPFTFTSFNAASKLSGHVLTLWARILQAAPNTQLLLKARGLDDPWVRDRALAILTGQGIAPDRLELVGYVPSAAAHLALYARADLALDTYPYNGTTTTCEALWMGTPMVTLAGPVHASRVGASLLSAAGLDELVAHTPDQYVELAASLARAPHRMADLRSGLRERIAASTLCDAPAFTRRLEEAYRDMWRAWCGSPGR